jgi:hypothetical protein
VGLVARGKRFVALKHEGLRTSFRPAIARQDFALSQDLASLLPATTIYLCIKTSDLTEFLATAEG